MSIATDVALIELGERFEKLLLEHMDAWLDWAPRMRAAHAEVRDNTTALAAAIRRSGCDVAQARMSELERHMQPPPRRSLSRQQHRWASCALRRSWPSGRHFRATRPMQARLNFPTHHGRYSMRSPK